MAIAQRAPQFEERNVQLIGLSVDSVYSHLAWQASIEEHFGVRIPFPVIADLDQRVANLYGMVPPGATTTVAVRTVFFIDDQGINRAMLYYPLSLGRDIDELLRVIDGLQANAQQGVATPANWRRGQPVVIPAPVTTEGMRERLAHPTPTQKAWYYRTSE